MVQIITDNIYSETAPDYPSITAEFSSKKHISIPIFSNTILKPTKFFTCKNSTVLEIAANILRIPANVHFFPFALTNYLPSMQPRFQMAHYKVTVKMNVYRADVRLVKGMSVNLVMNSPSFSPLYHKNGQEIVDAFMRIYGIDLRKINAVNSGVLEVEKLG